MRPGVSVSLGVVALPSSRLQVSSSLLPSTFHLKGFEFHTSIPAASVLCCPSPIPDLGLPTDPSDPARKLPVIQWDEGMVRRWADLQLKLKPRDLEQLRKHRVDGVQILALDPVEFTKTDMPEQLPWGLRWTSLKKILAERDKLIRLNAEITLGTWLAKADPEYSPGIFSRPSLVKRLLEKADVLHIPAELETDKRSLEYEQTEGPEFGGDAVTLFAFGERGVGKSTLISILAKEILEPRSASKSRAPFIVDLAEWFHHANRSPSPLSLGKWFEIQTGHHWKFLLGEAEFPRDVFIDNAHLLFPDEASGVFIHGARLETEILAQEELDVFRQFIAGLTTYSDLVLRSLDPALGPEGASTVPSVYPPSVRLWLFGDSRGQDIGMIKTIPRLSARIENTRDPNHHNLLRSDLEMSTEEIAELLLERLPFQGDLAKQCAEILYSRTKGSTGLVLGILTELSSWSPQELQSVTPDLLETGLRADAEFLDKVCRRGLLSDDGRELPNPGELFDFRVDDPELLKFWENVCRAEDIPPIKSKPLPESSPSIRRTPALLSDPKKGYLGAWGEGVMYGDQLNSRGIAIWDADRAYLTPLPLVKSLWKLQSEA